MTLPGLLFGLVIASLYASIYHLARGGSAWHLFLYLALSWAGFTAGHWLGYWLGWSFLRLGPLNMGAATIGSLILLGLGDWLSRLGSQR
jgi:hypothetical protein